MAGLSYSTLPTERPHRGTRGLDRMTPAALWALLDREDGRMLRAVGAARAPALRAVDLIVRSLSAGGRLVFAGAGTSGRLGVLEAAECPPTFGTAPGRVRAVMAGGRPAVFLSREGAEDRSREAEDVLGRLLRPKDVLVGVAASGVTPFVGGALRAARRVGAGTILVTCNPGAGGRADVTVALRTGPEILTGSTRLKAGTATKIILNRLTTLAMVRLGKVHGHWMVDLQPRSAKLRARALALVERLGRVPAGRARRVLARAGGKVKAAILMARRGLTRREAERALRRAGGFLGKALDA